MKDIVEVAIAQIDRAIQLYEEARPQSKYEDLSDLRRADSLRR